MRRSTLLPALTAEPDAVDRAVDQPGIHTLPQRPGRQQLDRLDDRGVVDLVDVVLVEQQPVNRPRSARAIASAAPRLRSQKYTRGRCRRARCRSRAPSASARCRRRRGPLRRACASLRRARRARRRPRLRARPRRCASKVGSRNARSGCCRRARAARRRSRRRPIRWPAGSAESPSTRAHRAACRAPCRHGRAVPCARRGRACMRMPCAGLVFLGDAPARGASCRRSPWNARNTSRNM